jgi:signal-transduction protein with cAMP-binding, CBS, and nucleotidyltransferase domain
MRVSELMRTPPVECRPSATMQEVAGLMAARNVGSVLVVDNIGYLAGIVTDRDITVRGVGQGHGPETPVEQIMTRDVAAVGVHSDLAEAAAVMQKRAVRRVPVVDEMGRIHGVVAFDDLFRNLSHEADTLMDAVLSQETGAV